MENAAIFLVPVVVVIVVINVVVFLLSTPLQEQVGVTRYVLCYTPDAFRRQLHINFLFLTYFDDRAFRISSNKARV